MTEVELAQKFVEYLEPDYDLYFEAPPHHVDIVAISGQKRIAIEVKLSLNFKVIEQAYKNLHWFHLSYVAVRATKRGSFAYDICKKFGIGVLEYDPSEWHKYRVREVVKPVWQKLSHIAFNHVHYKEYMKRSIPGSPGSEGAVVTPFKITVELLEKYVGRHPGTTLKEAIQSIDHHYSSFSGAKSCIYGYIKTGVIKGIYLENGKLYLRRIRTKRKGSSEENP